MIDDASQTTTERIGERDLAARVPPHLYFLVSAIFHYLGPSFAVLLFGSVPVLGVAWLRIATAAVVFAIWRRPWRVVRCWSWAQRRLLIALGGVLAVMNVTFYLAIDRLPLGMVGAIEFLGPVALAAYGVRARRNGGALALAFLGVYLLTDVRLSQDPWAIALAFANCACFLLYVVLGHRIARDGGGEGIDRLGASMIVALLVVSPAGLEAAVPALVHPRFLLAGIAVGVCSSVIPYATDQLAMARLPRSTFAFLLATLPAWATVVGVVVLRQVPSGMEALGVALIVIAVAIHEEPSVNG